MEGLSVGGVISIMQCFGVGTHGILQSQSGLQNYFNMEHAFNLIFEHDVFQGALIPGIRAIDAYRKDFFDSSQNGLKNYVSNYYGDSTFDVIIFPSKIPEVIAELQVSDYSRY